MEKEIEIPAEFQQCLGEANNFQDTTRICKVCHDEFITSAAEVANFFSYCQQLPKRCKKCRERKNFVKESR